jgi:hypothetical protein
MGMTLLETLQEFCDRRGLDRPSSVMSSQDDTIRQLRGLANEVISDITNRGTSWAKLQKQATFTTIANENQGAISVHAPYGFKYIIENTVWDRTNRRPLFGPRNAPAWQENEALIVTGPLYTYRVWQGNFYIQPEPPAGNTIAFEYASDMAIAAEDGVTFYKRFTNDTDEFLLDDDLLLMGLKWKWAYTQGLPYKQDKIDYEAMLVNSIGGEPTKKDVNLAGGSQDLKPGIWVPAGNWPVGS